MSISITGTYQNGQIIPNAIPEGIERARVTVEFVELLAQATPQQRRARRRGIIYFGMFAPPVRQFTSDEDLEQVKKSWNAKLDETD